MSSTRERVPVAGHTGTSRRPEQASRAPVIVANDDASRLQGDSGVGVGFPIAVGFVRCRSPWSGGNRSGALAGKHLAGRGRARGGGGMTGRQGVVVRERRIVRWRQCTVRHGVAPTRGERTQRRGARSATTRLGLPCRQPLSARSTINGCTDPARRSRRCDVGPFSFHSCWRPPRRSPTASPPRQTVATASTPVPPTASARRPRRRSVRARRSGPGRRRRRGIDLDRGLDDRRPVRLGDRAARAGLRDPGLRCVPVLRDRTRPRAVRAHLHAGAPGDHRRDGRQPATTATTTVAAALAVVAGALMLLIVRRSAPR